ncbi:MAG: hypothetical protein EOP10_12500 [Proteobacteria bacterium]|nr:MAG: hypothetical protein EOP10_12500 [Pseudomonadota bacterium]
MMMESISYGREKFIEAISILSGPDSIRRRVIAAFRELQFLESKHFIDPEDFRRFSNLRFRLTSSRDGQKSGYFEDFIEKGSLEEILAVSGIISSLAAAVILK